MREEVPEGLNTYIVRDATGRIEAVVTATGLTRYMNYEHNIGRTLHVETKEANGVPRD